MQKVEKKRREAYRNQQREEIRAMSPLRGVSGGSSSSSSSSGVPNQKKNVDNDVRDKRDTDLRDKDAREKSKATTRDQRERERDESLG